MPVTLKAAIPATLMAAGPEALALRAMSENSEESAAAIAALRDLGPEGLEALFATYRNRIATLSAEPDASRVSNPEWLRLTAALDAVSRQKDSVASRLYWYTDLERAKAAAKLSGKPILSLRLLGNLDQEFSCANSRFFRTVLYANAELSEVLRDRFILHWKSVRPAPRVTIDFGDGRKIETTLTGNSIHYILDPEGRPLDAIPGLYGPKAFLKELLRAEAACRTSATLAGSQREASLRSYHETRLSAISEELQADQKAVFAALSLAELLAEQPVVGTAPTAATAAPLAAAKAAAERKTLRSIGTSAVPAGSPTAGDSEYWQKIAALHAGDAKLDAGSIALIRAHYPAIDRSDPALSRIVQNFERSIALDTVRNEYLMHATLHRWLATGRFNADVERLNEEVYARLFLTPRSDPWLGLLPADIYTGLVSDGVSR
jgi:hypothetical protein